VSDSPKPPARRLTLTLPTLAAAREIWFLVLGESKARVVAHVLSDEDSPLPAARVARSGPRVRWLLDAAAAGEL
jgi:6-phosphogluconolactonase